MGSVLKVNHELSAIWPTARTPVRVSEPEAVVPEKSLAQQQVVLKPSSTGGSRRDGWLLVALVVSVHAWLLQAPSPTEAEPLLEPEALPMSIEFAAAPSPIAPTPEVLPPVAQPEPPAPVVDELAIKPPGKPKPLPVKTAPAPSPVKPAPPTPAPAKQAAPVASPAPLVAPAPAPAPIKETAPLAYAAYLNNPAPEYPAFAQRRGWQGTVQVRVQVSAAGLPGTVQLQTSSGHSVLDEAALRAVKRWRFVPAKRGEQAVSGWVSVPLEFRLN